MATFLGNVAPPVPAVPMAPSTLASKMDWNKMTEPQGWDPAASLGHQFVSTHTCGYTASDTTCVEAPALHGKSDN